jgi:hypothetical protein
MFDSAQLLELAHIKADRYQRAGGGGTHKVHNSSKAYDDAHGYQQMSPWEQLVYRTNMLWQSESRSAVAGFKWDCRWLELDKDANGNIPF